MDSVKAVDAPRKAITHIQNTAPGPPMAIAVATPTTLPVPTLPDRATQKAWNGEKLSPSARRRPKSSLAISPTLRNCTQRVRIVKYKPAPTRSTMRAGLQTKL